LTSSEASVSVPEKPSCPAAVVGSWSEDFSVSRTKKSTRVRVHLREDAASATRLWSLHQSLRVIYLLQGMHTRELGKAWKKRWKKELGWPQPSGLITMTLEISSRLTAEWKTDMFETCSWSHDTHNAGQWVTSHILQIWPAILLSRVYDHKLPNKMWHRGVLRQQKP
jgi:hypothetical protein